MNNILNVYMIGSVKWPWALESVEKYLKTNYGSKIFLKRVYPDPYTDMETLIKDCYGHIKKADLIIAVTKEDGSLGAGTTYEKVFAEEFLGKTVIKINPTKFLSTQFDKFEEIINKI